jgi:DNA-binding transcriptional regulator YdaS (Cro superfamily)
MLLSKYLETEGLSAFSFAVKCGISPTMVSFIINRKIKDIALSIALRIHSASDGNVMPQDLLDEIGIHPTLRGKHIRKKSSEKEIERPHNNNNKAKKNKNK